MKITAGLFDNMVLQRDGTGLSFQPVEGTCGKDENGLVTMTAYTKRKVLEKFNGRTIGSSSNGAFKAVVKGLPPGGPYQIRLSIARGKKGRGSVWVNDVFVGDVWILAGQSNMQGNGYRKDRRRPHPGVRAFYMDDHWDMALDPLHDLGIAIDECHKGATIAPHIGTGPGVAFGQSLYALTGIPQGLIACAHGGTSMSQWSPALKNRGGASLYGAMVRRFIKNGSKIAGVFWYQGCSDVGKDDARAYTRRMKELVRSMRKDFGNPALPFVMVQIARVCRVNDNTAGWNSIRDQQRLLPEKIRNLLTVPAIDLGLDDMIHLSGTEQDRLGLRCADAMSLLKYQNRGAFPPIELNDVSSMKDPDTRTVNVRVKFNNVSGKLVALSRPTGFILSDHPDRMNADPVYKIELQGDQVLLKTSLTPSEFGCKHLFYGFGNNPYCNITDSADRSLPAFGPIPVRARILIQ
ncbi:MAG: sialate O-acetylesterase [Fibrobacterota bacterium]